MNTASPASLSVVPTIIESAATIAFALSGLLAAARKRLDAVGVCMVAGQAAFGSGVLRDMVCNEIPSAFSDHRPYAICAFVGGWVLILATMVGVSDEMALIGAALITALMRSLALLTDFSLPRWLPDEERS